jgi:hypothetical protein
MSLANRIYSLFSGSDIAHGTFDVKGADRSTDGKKKGVARVVREPATVEMWEEHIKGGTGLGVIPIKSDNMCQWGAIDIDDYKTDHKALVQTLRQHKVPAVVGRSKSGGAHIWFFLTEPIPASDMQHKLQGLAASLGKADCEIFPKQSEILAERGDTGNFLNMPYHNGTANMRFGFNDEGSGLTLDEFVAYAESFLQKPEEFYAIDVSFGLTESSHLPDGPPCLQYLCAKGFVPGSRNNALFNLGVYARQADPDNWESLVQKYNLDYFHPPLARGEVETITKQLKRKDYYYKCEDQPIKPHCNKDLCKTRKFGVGQGAASSVTGIIKIDGDPPIFIVTIDGRPVETSTEGVHNQAVFQKDCIRHLNIFPQTINSRAWEIKMQNLLNNVVIVPVAPDATAEGEFKDLLRQFCVDRAKGNDLEDLQSGISVWLEDGIYFLLKDLKKHLQANDFKNFTGPKMSLVMKKLGGGEVVVEVGEKTLNAWKFPREAFGRSPAPRKIPDMPVVKDII